MIRTKEEKVFLANLGKKMRSYREKNGWTLEHCEEEGWPSWRHIQKIERGGNNMTVLTLRRLSKLYKIPFSKILD